MRCPHCTTEISGSPTKCPYCTGDIVYGPQTDSERKSLWAAAKISGIIGCVGLPVANFFYGDSPHDLQEYFYMFVAGGVVGFLWLPILYFSQPNKK